MRIVVDLQGAQTESRFRGIGRWSLAFAQALARNAGEHEIVLALNGLFPDTIAPLRSAFQGLVPSKNIRVWHAPAGVSARHPGNEWRRRAGEVLREHFLSLLAPDIVHVTSLFEGYADEAITGTGLFGRDVPVSVTFYDLIPLLNEQTYLAPSPQYETFYRDKIASLKQASLHLAISEYARSEAIEALGIGGDRVRTVSTAVGPEFRPLPVTHELVSGLARALGLVRPFVLYTGGADDRKNLPRLIEAFARLPPDIRSPRHLVLGGKIPTAAEAELRAKAAAVGLSEDDVRITGYVDDPTLRHLYAACELFVFPSWHEGFGLPVLEAMACGAPVIAAGTTSLPEVVGLPEALFDPFDVLSIRDKLHLALSDREFRERLRAQSALRAPLFSWDLTARRAIAAFEETVAIGRRSSQGSQAGPDAVITALAACIPERHADEAGRFATCLSLNLDAGIERQLLVDVSEIVHRDAATGVQRVVRSYLSALLRDPPRGYRVEPVYATRTDGYRYARRLAGGAEADGAEDPPIHWQRGDVFFALDLQHDVQTAQARFLRQLRASGVTVVFMVYDLLPIELPGCFPETPLPALHSAWLRVVCAGDGAICISKATADALSAWIKGEAVPTAPLFRISWVHMGGDLDGAPSSRGVPEDADALLACMRQRLTFLCVSTIEPRKRQEQILDAVERLWSAGEDVALVLVGRTGWKSETLIKRIRNHSEIDRRLFWISDASDEYLDRIYASATCLIAASLNEGFGLSLIEAARHRIPIVARDIPVFREVAGDHAFYFRGMSSADLAVALTDWLAAHRAGTHPRSDGLAWLTWAESAARMTEELVRIGRPVRQVLVDVSELVRTDAKTGIQRVVRSILREWLTKPMPGHRIEPVYAAGDHGYRYARRFTHGLLGLGNPPLGDEPVEVSPGDLFLGLDLSPGTVIAHKGTFAWMRAQGVRVTFVVYDLLCLQLPDCFPPGTDALFRTWIEVVAAGDGAICISQSVAADVVRWREAHAADTGRPFAVQWFHLGADVENSVPTRGLPPHAPDTLANLRRRPSFLMVGTLEPRKGHAQVLDAFERLWTEGVDVNLTIVGKKGWMVDELTQRLVANPLAQERLEWIQDASDEYLSEIYAASTCLIAASLGEGFGLPLIEAARYRIPILARDIPVFREVAGPHAAYFASDGVESLALAVRDWLALHERGAHPRSENLPWLTWAQSAAHLRALVVDSEPELQTSVASTDRREVDSGQSALA
jgi:glycosyltransferase involved in cell wall biosynthesis